MDVQVKEMSTAIYKSRYIITDVTTVKFIGQWIFAGNWYINFNQLYDTANVDAIWHEQQRRQITHKINK